TLIAIAPYSLLAVAIDTSYVINLSFARWILFGVPIAWTFILIACIYLVKFAYPSELKKLPGGKEVIANEKSQLGKASYEEKMVFTQFVFASRARMSRSCI